ncbi:hypothetical protein [Desulfobacter sp.]|uniref:hypothetical protein n=1 Tax=Desulfobacter sp. TaxID=2294 RepID=UPI0025805379|nr:hypothetical protein [Desulfobacter sp.]
MRRKEKQITDQDHIDGIIFNCIMAQYSSRTFEFEAQELSKTAVIEVKILGMTAKRSG